MNDNNKKTFRQPRVDDEERYREPIFKPGGGIFCCGCLENKPADDISADPRYCHDCYDFLKKEAEQITYSRKKLPFWLPGNFVMPKENTSAKISPSKIPTIAGYRREIMSTVNDQKPKVDIIQPQPPKVTIGKRGPKFTDLPEDLISELAGQGMGSKAITAELAKQGYFVSYKTVQRRLQGVLL